MYPDPRVSELISQRFVPVRIHIKEQPTMWKRFDVRWTPTVLVLAPDGKELPEDELRGQLELALGFLAVEKKDWPNARQEFERVVDLFPETDAGPEALYWSGVAQYSATHDATALKDLGRKFKERYTDTSWAKRASIW